MGLSSGQRRHLVSAYATVSHLLLQMEEAGSNGRSPTGVGSPLTPLPANELDAIISPLRDLQARLRERAAALAPLELAAFERPQSAAVTRVWLSSLLEKLREAVDGLRPRKMRSYGVWTEADERSAAELHAELTAKVHEARAAIKSRSPQRRPKAER